MVARKECPDADLLQQLIEVETLTQAEVARRFGVNRNHVRKWCRELGLVTQRTGPRGGERHPGWRGGRTQRKGYWYVHQPDHPHATKSGYVLEHRLVMEGTLGRYLHPSEVVHHRDGDRENNDPHNLEVFPCNADHLRHELAGRVPNWTEDGKRRIREGVRRKRKRHPQSGSGARPTPRTMSRQSS